MDLGLIRVDLTISFACLPPSSCVCRQSEIEEVRRNGNYYCMAVDTKLTLSFKCGEATWTCIRVVRSLAGGRRLNDENFTKVFNFLADSMQHPRETGNRFICALIGRKKVLAVYFGLDLINWTTPIKTQYVKGLNVGSPITLQFQFWGSCCGVWRQDGLWFAHIFWKEWPMPKKRENNGGVGRIISTTKPHDHL